MAFSIVLKDAAAQYGIGGQSAASGSSLESIIGTPTSMVASWGSGQLTGGQSGTITITYSHAFTLAVQVTQVNSTTATITHLSLRSPTAVDLLTYTGSLAVTSTNLEQSLTDTVALAGGDTITGNSYDNVLQGWGGSDVIDGGAGIDTCVLSGNKAAYIVTNTSGALRTTGPDGIDRMTNVERLQFDDYSLAFDVTGQAGQVYRLYKAALDRAPEAGGLGYYIDVLEQGWGLYDIAGNFLRSPEFNSHYGTNLTDLAFVQQLYRNVLGREGEAAGVAYHQNELATGWTRAQVLVAFSESPENQASLLGVMSQGMAFIPV